MRKFGNSEFSTKPTNFYNLELIIAVGFRVKSSNGTKFRIWANEKLKEYLVKGYNMNVERFKNNGYDSYFGELLDKIRDIRSSEKVFWRKILDIYSTSIDYNPKQEITINFFKTVQNKMHYAVSNNTAAEIVFNRVDSNKDNIGLTNFKGNIPTRKETEIAKNYLTLEELQILNRLVSAYLDVVESSTETGKYDLFIGAKDGVIANEDSSTFFYDFIGLEIINFNNNFDTSNVTNMASMFAGKWVDGSHYNEMSLKEIKGLENFDTSKVVSMQNLFNLCSELVNFDVSHFNTSNVIYMNNMFSNLKKITSINVSDFDTGNVTSMGGMFQHMYEITELDLSSFDTRNLTQANYMFNNLPKLTTIYVSDKFTNSKITSDYSMFYNNISLIGGNGTKYSDNYVNKEYARIDTTDTPGYFTRK